MAITRYTYSDANIAIAEATPKPREVWINGPIEVVVRTGADMQQTADRYVTAEQFRDRFTSAELSAILAAQQTDAQIAQFLYLVATATGPFSLDDPRVVAGLPYLVSKGLIAANRPEEIRE